MQVQVYQLYFQLLPYWEFRQHILGSQVPDFACKRLYEIFASQTVYQVIHELDDPEKPQTEFHCGMNLEDLTLFYAAFKNKNEIDHMSFWFLKMKTNREQMIKYYTEQESTDDPFVIHHKDVIHYVKRVLKMGDPELALFYQTINSQSLTVEMPISYDFYRFAFSKLKETVLFSWWFQLSKGYATNFLNYENETVTEDQKRLSIQSVEKSLIDQDISLSTEDICAVQDFYDREIKNKPGKYVLQIFNKLFSFIKHDVLREKYFIQNALSKSGQSYEFLCRLVQIICKESCDEEQKILFLFDIFSEFEPVMKRSQLKDFCDIFQIPISEFPSNTQNHDDFSDVCNDYEIAFDLYEVCKPMLLCMLCIIPERNDDEKNAIRAAVNNNPNIESYIQENFTSEIEQFYVCEMQFWLQWQNSIGFQEDKEAFGLRIEHKNLIQNSNILEPKHSYRIKDTCQYLSEYVLLPKFVFLPLSKWYGCDQILIRDIIEYKSALRISQRGMPQLQRQDSLRSSYSKNFMASGQKFNSKRPDVIDDDYIKTKGDIIQELEISPKVIYLADVDQHGELLYLKLVQQYKIDFILLKKLKLTELPFEELQYSRKTTFEQLLNIAAKTRKMNPKKGRLIIEGVKLAGTKLIQTFEDYQLKTGTLIHVEFINEANQWPSDRQTYTSIDQDLFVDNTQKTCGLQNLGNTCYMNSAIQVVANISQIYEYFRETENFRQQINPNQQSSAGLFAASFGVLMRQIWCNQAESVSPTLFKSILGKASVQYLYYEQQDSQEYLSFMIDLLHEELNLRLQKFYIPNPESNQRETISLGLECWSNSLRREWSLMYFIFYGQMRSTLVCKKCSTESQTFDIFSNVPVSLPEPTQQTINIIVHRLPNKVKDLVHSKITRQKDGSFVFPQFRVDDFEIKLEQKPVSSARNQNMKSKFNNTPNDDSFNYLTNDQPLRVQIKVQADTPISVILQKIISIKETNLDPTQTKTQTILYSINPKTKFVRNVFQNEDKLTELDLTQSEIYCQEVLTRKGRDIIREFYGKNSLFLEQFPDSKLRSLMFVSARHEIAEINTGKFGTTIQNSFEDRKQSVSSDLSEQLAQYKDLQIVCYHRRFVARENGHLSTHQPQLIASPFILNIPQHPSGRRLYDEVWAIASNLIKNNSNLQKAHRRWWERKDWTLNVQGTTLFKPFILKYTDKFGQCCHLCNWTKGCAGCIIEPTDAPYFIEGLSNTTTLVLEWHSETLNEAYNYISNEVIYHQSQSVNQDFQDAAIVNYTSLEDCLTKFHKIENLENDMKCGKCNDLTPHVKKLDIFRPPPVLIIQLKRFRQVGTIWRKVQTSVDFPIRNLDISHFVTDLEFLNQQSIETKYNLHGIVNHFGSLSYGHYTSYVLNQFDKKWYHYDDSKCTQLNENQLNKESAYILFYIRNDVQQQNIAQLYPQIDGETMFLGRPIKTIDGKIGYVVKCEADQIHVQFIDDPNRKTQIIKQVAFKQQFSFDQINQEGDSSKIVHSLYDNQRLEQFFQIIESEDFQRKVQQINKQEILGDQTTRCCNLFPGSNKKQKQEQVRRFDHIQNLRKLQLVESVNSKSRQSEFQKILQQTENKVKSQNNLNSEIEFDNGEQTDQDLYQNTTIALSQIPINQTSDKK